MKVGVLGGTFDPPHKGHLAIAQAALASLELDEVLFLPASRNPIKARSGGTPPRVRLEMVQRLVDGQPNLAVCDLEVTKGGLSYTVETMTELTVAQPAEYWFLLGSDALRSFPEWKQPQRLVRLCRLGVVIRPPVVESEVLRFVPEEFRPAIDLIPMSAMDVSSSDLRHRLITNQPVGDSLPPAVLNYIKQNKLYKS